ncbi:30S ribosomal protein S11 [Candidatus Peregrinibacteria bacterium]|nr:30S ribosomal protein S11 [Candidatus Peregrinibacteria bacterium]
MTDETKKHGKKTQEEVKAPEVAAGDAAAGTDVKKVKKSKKKNVPQGNIFVRAGFNNTLITVTDPEGNTIAWASAGACGFKGTKKSTPYAAQMAAESASEKAKAFGFAKADVYVKGVGTGREQALRGIIAQGIEILKIADLTPMPHNGCKKPRPRRV